MTPPPYTLSLHDALPILAELLAVRKNLGLIMPGPQQRAMVAALDDDAHVAEQHARYAARRTTLKATLESAGFRIEDRKSTRLNSSHDQISYAVFCLKKKT